MTHDDIEKLMAIANSGIPRESVTGRRSETSNVYSGDQWEIKISSCIILSYSHFFVVIIVWRLSVLINALVIV
jgi:hypothetical protein